MTDFLIDLAHPRGPDSYQQSQTLARGGMALIERVFDTRLGRDVARKLLPLDARSGTLTHSERRRLRRFLDEAIVQSHLQHPSILPVHDLGIDERGWPYFTMPVVQGRHFGQIIAVVHAHSDVGWTRERVLESLARVCEAVSYAHRKGVVHRDLKPENLMVGAAGEVLVLDFGLARVREPLDDGGLSTEFDTLRNRLDEGAANDVLTMDGDVLGTPAYMAPEQAAGDHGQVAPAADQYALGAVLYQLLTGTRPYGDRASTTARDVVTAVRQRSPTPVHELNRSAPPELCAICERAMERDPSARYASVGDMAADLRAFLEQRVVQAHATAWWARLRTWWRRNRRPAVASLAAAVALLGSVAAVLEIQSRQQADLQQMNAELRAQRAVADNRLQELRHQLYVGEITRAQQAIALQKDRSEVRAALDRCDPELRGWEWRYLSNSPDLSVRSFHHAAAIREMTVADDGAVLVTASDDGFARAWDVSSGELLCEFLVGEPTTAVALVGGTRALAVATADATVRLFDLTTRSLLVRSEPLSCPQTTVCGSTDGHCMVSIGKDQLLHIWRLPGLERTLSLPIKAAAPKVHLHADGHRVFVHAGDRFVSYDTDSGKQLHEWTVAGSEGCSHIAFDPKGTRLRSVCRGGLVELDVETGECQRLPLPPHGNLRMAVGSDRRVVCVEHGFFRVFDAATQTAPPGCQGHWAAITNMAIDPTRRRLFTGDSEGTVETWDLASLEKPDRHPTAERILEVGAVVHDVALSPDGHSLAVACGDDKLRVWRLDGDEPPQVEHVRAGLVSIDWLSPPNTGGRWVVLGREPAHGVLWDAATLTPCEVLHFIAPNAASLRTSVDGRFIVRAPRVGWADQGSLAWYEWRSEGWFAHHLPAPAASMDIAISSAGPRVATADVDGRVRVYDLIAERRILDIEIGATPARAVTWAPDGKRLAAACEEAIYLLDANTGARVATLIGHKGWVDSLLWSADGRRLFSHGGYADDQLKVWDPDRCEERLSLPLDAMGRPYSLDISADGRVLVAGRTKRVHVWRLP